MSARTQRSAGAVATRVRKLSVSLEELRDVKGTTGAGICPDGKCHPPENAGIIGNKSPLNG